MCLVATALANATASTPSTSGYYRMPAIHGDTVVFVSEGDLWRVNAAGGDATRLTSHAGEERDPSISPDGTTLAFTATYEGPREVYTMPLAGGLPVRRTWDAGRVGTTGWEPDGTLLLDGRFTLTGSGSEQDPFVIGWPLLFSANETIDAKADRLAVPPRIDFLNGQWVQISGFLAPPLWGVQTKELLVMKNRWDGCCIGLPPTPFDCIEAELATPIKLGAQHTISFGVIRGRL
ncbi:MAG: hypothetical protein EBR71_02290, partial [Planctomycetes bacterium]|nr:hypothetical protein [Planctomycetota bacterium]